MKKGILTVFCLILAGVSGYIYMDHVYFYQPFAFEQDAVTHQEWNDYKEPIKMKYHNFEQSGEDQVIEQEEKIRQLLRALKQAESVNVNASQTRQQATGGLTLSSDGDLLLEVLFFSNHWELMDHQSEHYDLTPRLKEHLSPLSSS
ncbi:hypothetical protein [Thalassobacillus sp. CUG 92003]|uniref:hypothetical protein n=1 Tax=Thalassobacillus sp. CUG 92003 TaxID=2736641 RepID=UPI0015E77D18|nr:hypothetical protein [Thalassobacillus sp. CUG 92003]